MKSLKCFMCGMEIPAERTYYNISLNEERERKDEVLDKTNLLVCCVKCGDSENMFYMFKRACQEVSVLE